MTTPLPTILTYQHNANLHTIQTKLTAIHPFDTLAEPNRNLFKQATNEDHVLITEETIFHPQGGGQPSDTGTITSTTSAATFTVSSVRMDVLDDGQVLHLGRFSTPTVPFTPGESVTQTIDAQKRLLYSRLHTAGHVLGAAVRHLLEDEIEGFDELKASHFPDSAACEFRGLIEGKWKGVIQEKVDEFVRAEMPVEVEWWGEEEFKERGLERLIPERRLGPGEKWRVVNIVGAEVYPCGGTHVERTDLCGGVTVRKISRSKGVSKVGYAVD
ncbi:putative alanine--tRNA ligase [Aspergillus alliaceus]|uniref:putative alanine--tRNA ligase n=1 Tax=Petromyces alliaceus TaxID=209559 RepID=UPI0012A54A9F|nr:putative alanyl-tRNA synthetase [Aspergillus alliaceus]KAB8234424.1 putative alanyl-tRNA synthetase [Aspergillus alliaceus]